MRQVCVTRQRVLDYIVKAQGPLDTYQIAEALSNEEQTIPERSVRAAVTWLVLGEYLQRDDKPVIRTDINGLRYKVWLYVWTGKNTPIINVRRNAEEREIQSWGDGHSSGVFLDNLFLKMRTSIR